LGAGLWFIISTQERKIADLAKVKKMPCFKCGKNIELGDVFYSKIPKRYGKNFIRHFCEDCYKKQFVTV